MSQRKWVTLLLACGFVGAVASGCGTLIIAGPSYTGAMKETLLDNPDGNLVLRKIAVVTVDGVLSDSESQSLLGSAENTVSAFREQLWHAENDGLVRAVIVRVNSPGGGVTASDVMYNELMEFRKRTKKPVVVMLMDTAASGGYYVALGGDHVIAHPTCITGSIGVILQLFNVEGLLGKIGVTTEAIKSAPMKDLASPLRKMTDEERAVLKGITDSLYGRFVKLVAERRNLEEAVIRPLADGRVFTADQALAKGLVDQVGYMADAVAKAKALAGIRRARIVGYQRPLGYKGSIYALGGPSQVNLLNIDLGQLAADRRPTFLYLWAPGE